MSFTSNDAKPFDFNLNATDSNPFTLSTSPKSVENPFGDIKFDSSATVTPSFDSNNLNVSTTSNDTPSKASTSPSLYSRKKATASGKLASKRGGSGFKASPFSASRASLSSSLSTDEKTEAKLAIDFNSLNFGAAVDPSQLDDGRKKAHNSSSLVEALNFFRNKYDYADVLLVDKDGIKLPAHAVILASRSPILDSWLQEKLKNKGKSGANPADSATVLTSSAPGGLLAIEPVRNIQEDTLSAEDKDSQKKNNSNDSQNNSSDSNNNGSGLIELHFPDYSSSALQSLLDACYSAPKVHISPESLGTTTRLASFLHCAALKSLCAGYVWREISVKNACRLFCDDDLDTASQQIAMSFIQNKMQLIISEGKSSGFDDMPPEKLQALVSCEELNVSEVDLFRAVVNWATQRLIRQNPASSSDPKERTAAVREILEQGGILEKIRFAAMSQSDIILTVQPSGILSQAELIELFTALANRNATTKWERSKRKPAPEVRRPIELGSGGEVNLSEGSLWEERQENKDDREKARNEPRKRERTREQ
jgi:hypothetical protein